MKVLVAVKRVVDYNVKVRVKADNSGIDLANVKMSDESVLRNRRRRSRSPERNRRCDRNRRVSVGPANCQEQLRTALALGADRAILVETDEELHPLAVAKLLKAMYDKEQPQLVHPRQAEPSTATTIRPGRCSRRLRVCAQGTFASKVERC